MLSGGEAAGLTAVMLAVIALFGLVLRWMVGRLTQSLDRNTDATNRQADITVRLTSEVATSITASSARHERLMERLVHTEEATRQLLALMNTLAQQGQIGGRGSKS